MSTRMACKLRLKLKFLTMIQENCLLTKARFRKIFLIDLVQILQQLARKNQTAL